MKKNLTPNVKVPPFNPLNRTTSPKDAGKQDAKITNQENKENDPKNENRDNPINSSKTTKNNQVLCRDKQNSANLTRNHKQTNEKINEKIEVAKKSEEKKKIAVENKQLKEELEKYKKSEEEKKKIEVENKQLKEELEKYKKSEEEKKKIAVENKQLKEEVEKYKKSEENKNIENNKSKVNHNNDKNKNDNVSKPVIKGQLISPAKMKIKTNAKQSSKESISISNNLKSTFIQTGDAIDENKIQTEKNKIEEIRKRKEEELKRLSDNVQQEKQEQEIEELKKDLEKKNKEIIILKKENLEKQKLEEEMKKIKTENDKITKELEDEKMKNNADKNEEIERLKEEMKKVKTENDKITKELEKKNEEIIIENLEKQKLEEEMKKIKTENDKITKELEDEKMKNNADKNEEIERLKEEMKKVKTENDKITKELEKKNEEMKNNVDKNEEIERLKEEMKKVKTENDKYKEIILKIQTKLYNEVIVEPRGLVNNSTYCFLNSVIQSIRSCAEFVKVVLDIKSHSKCVLTHNFHLLLKSMKTSEKKDINEYIKNIQSNFEYKPAGDDVHKFFMSFFSKVHKEILDEKVDYTLQPISSHKEYEKYREKNKSIIFDFFYGIMNFQLICNSCQSIHSSYQMFKSLPLPISKKKEPATIQDCLNDSLAGSIVEMSDPMNCCSNKNQEIISKQQIVVAPMYLLIYLNRGSPYQGGQKNNTKVDVPNNNITISTEDKGDVSYRLIAVVDHLGNNEGGHYFCKCNYECFDGPWWLLNDSSVSTIKNEEIVTAASNLFIFKLF